MHTARKLILHYKVITLIDVLTLRTLGLKSTLAILNLVDTCEYRLDHLSTSIEVKRLNIGVKTRKCLVWLQSVFNQKDEH